MINKFINLSHLRKAVAAITQRFISLENKTDVLENKTDILEDRIDDIGAGGTQSDWAEDDSTDPAYIQNKPAIRAGEGENSIVEGQIDNSEAQTWTIYITGAAKATTFTYTTQDDLSTLPSNTNACAVYIDSGSSAKKFQRIESIDTANNTITFKDSVNTSALSNSEAVIYYHYQEAKGTSSHTEGRYNISANNQAHAEGTNTVASGIGAHAEGNLTSAIGNYSHAEGTNTYAANYSHAEGAGTIANCGTTVFPQHAEGKYNIKDDNQTYIHIAGNGSSSARSNAYTLDWSGNGWFAGKVSAGTIANPASVVNANDLATKAYVDAHSGSSDVFWVNFELAPEQPPEEGISWLTADKTFAEVVSAHTAGKIVKGAYWGYLYTLAYDLDATSSQCIFECDDFSIYGNNDDGIVNSYNVHIQWQVSNNEETITVFYEHAYMPDMAYDSYTNGQILQYNSTSGKWEAENLPSIPIASTTLPVVDGTASIGSSSAYAKADHVHPKITQALSISSNVITLTGSDGTTSSVTLPVYNGGVVVSA